MSRLDRLKEYAGKPRGLQGESRDKENLAGWAARAKENSRIAPRASDGPMKLPNTGKAMNLRDTGSRPFRSRSDARAEAKADLNHVGESDYLKSVRRQG